MENPVGAQSNEADHTGMTSRLLPEEEAEFLAICEAIFTKDNDRFNHLLYLNRTSEIFSKYLTLKVSGCSCGFSFEKIGGTTLVELRQMLNVGSCEHVNTLDCSIWKTAGIKIVHWVAAHGTGKSLMEILTRLSYDFINSPTLLHQLPPLAVAVAANNTDMVRTLIENRARLDLNVKARNSVLLDKIVWRDTTTTSSIGVNLGGLKNWYNIERPLLLYFISEDVDVDTLKMLLKGVKFNSEQFDETGQTALRLAVQNNNIEILSALLVAGADPNFCRACSPLVLPVLFDTIDIIDKKDGFAVSSAAALLKFGANPNHCLDNGLTPLYHAVQTDKEELVELLLNYGAEPNTQTAPPILNAACRNAHRMVQSLVNHGADVNVVDGLNYTSLHRAGAFGFRETAEIVLATGRANLELKTENHQATALNMSAMSNNRNVLEILVRHGCDVRTSDRYCNTPLHYMSVNGCCDSVQLLLTFGADPDARNAGGASPLWNAVQSERLDVCKILLRQDVDLSVKSQGIKRGLGSRKHIVFNIYLNPRSLLWVAVERENTDLVDLLLNCGLDIHAEKWILTNFKETENDDPIIRDNLIQLMATPTSLMLLCRKCVLQTYGRNLSNLPSVVQIPPALMKLLLLT